MSMPNCDPYVQFIRIIQEMLKDAVSNQIIEKTFGKFNHEARQCFFDYGSNIEMMMLFIKSVIKFNPSNGRPFIDQQLLHQRAKLMQKFIIQDDCHMLDFLAKTIEYLHQNHLNMEEIDKVITILHSTEVIPLFIRNHWTYARNPKGNHLETTTLDRLRAIKHCFLFKYSLLCDTNEIE
ncbi:hypothetical protein QR98_0088320 [Sarcoptes scabiei]|nr:hypothetical protein QR98_0088320 [Sarcoptes scabiei]